MTARPPEDRADLTNPRAERVRNVRALLAGTGRRRAGGAFVAEGPQAVREAVLAHRARDLFVTPAAAQRHADIVHGARGLGVTVRTCTDQVLAAMGDTVTPQGLLAVCMPEAPDLAAILEAEPALAAVLVHVRDPGNAGTVIRAADAAGADAVVLTEASVDPTNPKCVRASAGSLFHLPVVVGQELPALVARLRASGLSVLAADGSGEDLDDLQDLAAQGEGPLSGRVAWLFGNEAWGMSEQDLALADTVVRVPVHGRAESLNLATAATVCLYASARARRRRR